MINLNRPPVIPGKLDATDFDQPQPAEACTELGAGAGERRPRSAWPLRALVLAVLLVAGCALGVLLT